MEPVRLTVLGSGDAFGAGGRLQACLHLSGGAEPLLIDCGATSVIALKRAAIDPASIGYVAVSHLHGDHFAGIPWLILDAQSANRTNRLLIAGPAGTRERVDRTFGALYPSATEDERPFLTDYCEFSEGTALELGPATITPFEVRHGSGATPYALRIEYADKVIAYSGDTEWTDRLVDVADGADLFVCECSFFDTDAPGHLSYHTLLAHRHDLRCERIVITHMCQEMLAHLHESEFEAAADGLAITLY